ncbi:MAG: ROK family transcriptional regulator [Rubellimicrobium sp.]|nr:ROK family transcriptional regulator [Rubellimicrobium sp.]
MESAGPRRSGIGGTQSGLRDHNERLVLSLIQRHGALPGAELARMAALSQQTVSVILRDLKKSGLVARGAPLRGQVGKPRVPMALVASGVYSFGLKIGRRSCDLVLADFHGTILAQRHVTYRFPDPGEVLGFLERGIKELSGSLAPDARLRIAGIGIAMPWQIWNWHEVFGAPAAELARWKDFDIAREIGRFSNLPVYVENDATAACRAELMHGSGRNCGDFAYFYVGSFVGGGLVLNNAVHEGRFGNAGAFGPLPAFDEAGRACRLLDVASLYRLEAAVAAGGKDLSTMWHEPQNWAAFEPHLSRWIDLSARELARSILNVAAVLDIEAAVIDGAFPADVRDRLVDLIRSDLGQFDQRGVNVPEIVPGCIGLRARAIGAACGPVLARYLLG